MLGGRKTRSNKGKKRASYESRKHTKIALSPGGTRYIKRRKVRSNKGKKRGAHGYHAGKTRSGKIFRKIGGAPISSGTGGSPISSGTGGAPISSGTGGATSSTSGSGSGDKDTCIKFKFVENDPTTHFRGKHIADDGYVLDEILSMNAGSGAGLKKGMKLKSLGTTNNRENCSGYVCGNEERFKILKKRLLESYDLFDDDRNVMEFC